MDDESNGGTALQERLKDPRTAETLAHLLDRLDALEGAIDRLATLVERAPGMLSMVTDIVDDAYMEAYRAGIDVDVRMRKTLSLLERLTAPEVSDRLERLLALVERGPGVMSMVTDIVDDGFRELREAGINVDDRMFAGLEAMERLTAPETLKLLAAVLENPEQFHALIESGVLDPQALKVVGHLGEALAKTEDGPPKPVGLVGAMRALRKPDTQRALGFLVEFGERFGQSLNGGK